MVTSYLAAAALSALAYSTVASAEPVQYCPIEGICYQVAVPSSSASSDSGNIYLQLRAPTSYSWVAFGTGSAMAGSNIFVMYQNGAGNVTISPRSGKGHIMPQYNSATQLELLDGSGLTNNDETMIANVRCGNCASWSGGSMSLASTGSDWIAAWKEGDAIDSTSTDATIQQHDAHDQWTFDLTQGTVSDDANPYVGVRQFDNNNRGVGQGSFADPRTLILGHGIIMAIVMVVMYPLGSALMPLFGKWLLHASWQFLAFLLMWAGFGLGIVASQRIKLDIGSAHHTILGTVVVCLMVVQPVLGWFHHRYFVKHQQRGIVSHAHIWYGRALLTMGVVNGGLGLQLAEAPRTFVVVYEVLAAIMFAIYIASAVLGQVRRTRRNRQPKNF